MAREKVNLKDRAAIYERLEDLSKAVQCQDEDLIFIFDQLEQNTDDTAQILACRAARNFCFSREMLEALLKLGGNTEAKANLVKYEALRALNKFVTEGDLWADFEAIDQIVPGFTLLQSASGLTVEREYWDSETLNRCFEWVLEELRLLLHRGDLNDFQRAGAVEALGALSSRPWVAPTLAAQWYSAEPRSRFAALSAAVQSAHKKWRELVLEALSETLQSGEEAFFRKSLEGLARLRLTKKTSFIVNQAREIRLRPSIRETAITCLGILRNKKSLIALHEIASNRKDPLRFQATQQIREINDSKMPKL